MATKIAILVLSILASQAFCAWGNEVSVVFKLTQHVPYGQVFKVVGNSAKLFDWDVTAGPSMTYSDGDVWIWTTTLEGGASYEYKAVVVDNDTGNCICWMPGDNRVLTLPSSSNTYVENMVWNPSCGTGSSCTNSDACSSGASCPSDFIYAVTA